MAGGLWHPVTFNLLCTNQWIVETFFCSFILKCIYCRCIFSPQNLATSTFPSSFHLTVACRTSGIIGFGTFLELNILGERTWRVIKIRYKPFIL